MISCQHDNVTCLNHFDTFRKYRCQRCDGVYVCECERKLAVAFLPHQLRETTDYETHERVDVTGFAPRVCAACRGEDELPYPRAAIWGQKGKVERFYWREIFKTECELILVWLNERGLTVRDIVEFRLHFPEEAKEFGKQAKEYWQTRHRTAPKYVLKEKTEAEFLAGIAVPMMELVGEYHQVTAGGKKIGKWQCADRLVQPEELAAKWYSEQGYEVIRCERRLVTTWLSTLLIDVIQDPTDPRQRLGYRNSTRGWRSDARNTQMISFTLPEDFGAEAYFDRQRGPLEAALESLLKSESIVGLFDERVPRSESLRDYLWVNEDDIVSDARRALVAVSPKIVVDCIAWAIRHFGARQAGWPDLFVHREGEFLFVEVKSPNDRLSQEQMEWFQWAVSIHLPCTVLRIKKSKLGDH